MTTRITDTTAKSQERLPRPIFNFIPIAEDTLTEIDRIAEERTVVDASRPSPLQGRVSPCPTISSWMATLTPDGSEDDETVDSESQMSGRSSPEFQVSTGSLNSSSGFSTPFITPESSPRKAASNKIPNTPEAVRLLTTVIEGHHPGYELSPDSKADMTSALRKVKQWQSPHEAKDNVRRSLAEALERSGSTTEVSSPLVVGRRLVFAATETDDIMGDWTTCLAVDLRFSFLDVKHLRDLERQGGFHICSADHPRDGCVIQRRTNLLTGVWCGRVCGKGDLTKTLKNFTSFVPRQMNLEHYQSLIAHAINTPACKIAGESNRRLYRIVDGKNTFVVECYLQEQGTRIRSAIPVFHYEVFNGKDKSFRIQYSYKWSLADNDPLICTSYEVVYAKLFELLEKCPEAIVNETDDKIIVDVGLLYNTPHPKYGSSCPIDQGLLVEISRKDL